ncbi:MAG: XdhC family protein, partial [Candidatus Muiribacteriota bacterium]
EAVRNPSRLVIAGVGHIGRELMRIASGTSEFICKGFDSRKDNVEVLTENYDVEYLNCYDGIEKELRRGDYVVVMTHGHGFDSKVIKSISKIEGLKYVGCIGSKNKVKIMIDELKETGNCDEFVKILHSPVGLKIGANTPFEIAISILSEIVCVKNTGESVCSMRI